MDIDSGEDNTAKGKDDPAYRDFLLNRKSSNYYRKFTQCSCNYNESKRDSIIYTYNKDDSKKIKFMLKKKIKMILCSLFLMEDEEMYYDKGQLVYKYDKVFTDQHREIEFENFYLNIARSEKRRDSNASSTSVEKRLVIEKIPAATSLPELTGITAGVNEFLAFNYFKLQF
ncbi:uncharacterized protein LOC118645682 [Monomorium pharaonis]|uniref:uncharacterized protein LOC118645682 n=1 Tax=Monomorium pharaonis TaxID=307658 RepID=UPI00174762B3|nr:uncharacterized protein LOC118645682 [Monomorium pharaonis]XP_036143195.1 uncharacterized protein LOC118645682 [Monomorium pharaonis]XP_036143196.1 uncharacterized protein LOC118645682 [Monomorium pharaonis]XP_036143197.1 uncharacterized protein LOC118645682 [Monomorium pharaonis]